MLIEPDVEAVSRSRFGGIRESQENFPETGQTRDIVARKVGLGSGRTYENYKRRRKRRLAGGVGFGEFDKICQIWPTCQI
jgi:hypothetical protein